MSNCEPYPLCTKCFNGTHLLVSAQTNNDGDVEFKWRCPVCYTFYPMQVMLKEDTLIMTNPTLRKIGTCPYHEACVMIKQECVDVLVQQKCVLHNRWVENPDRYELALIGMKGLTQKQDEPEMEEVRMQLVDMKKKLREVIEK